jgi:hypothetical protein
MKDMLKFALLPLASGWAIAHYAVLHYGNWYFGANVWLKAGLLTLPAALLLSLALLSAWRRPWLLICWWWIGAYTVSTLVAKAAGLSGMSFTQVLDFESAMVWLPSLILGWHVARTALRARFTEQRRLGRIARSLRLRRRLRGAPRLALAGGALYADGLQSTRTDTDGAEQATPQTAALIQPMNADGGNEAGGEGAPIFRGLPGGKPPLLLFAALLSASLLLTAPASADDAPAPDPKPAAPMANRHAEFTHPSLAPNKGDAFHSSAEPDGLQWGRGPEPPPWPGQYPAPAHLRERESFWLRIENQAGGLISAESGDGVETIGKVLAPVAQINPKGFTASGWGEPGHVCATAVNAIHIKTDQDYVLGQAAIFSLVPVQFADFNPKDYLSYFNTSSTIFTDIVAGEGLFGGRYAPLAGSRCFIGDADTPMPAGYVPKPGDVLLVKVERLKYAPEWIEFENRFGGLVWIKEIGLDPYPIAQVLRPVVGCGRFLGTEYAGVGRIRANHHGVIDISTSPYGVVGGFQIIPRDHAMSAEMYNARFKTQWMVVGPLWALDPSWEGLPPLFGDYIYPALVPPFNPDGTVNQDVHGSAAFLSSFEVKARYSDAEDPQVYSDMREAAGLDMEGFKTLTHLRLIFPRNGGEA